jgi:hypothetical protein
MLNPPLPLLMWPKALMLLPARMAVRREKLEPIVKKSITDIAEPKRPYVLTDKLLPNSVWCRIDSCKQEPNALKPIKLALDPRRTMDLIDIDEPRLNASRIDMELPRRANFLIDREEARLT